MYVITANVKKKGQSTSQMTNDKDYHMILVIIINERDETMLQRTLGSGWGVLLPGLLIAGLMYADLSPDQWRIVILMGLDPTRILVMSQVLLSFGIALALVPLLIFTSDSKLMGDLVNSKRVKQTGWVIVVLVVALNIWLLVGTALGL